MSKAFEHYVPRMATPDMTAEMESEMDQIAAGEMSRTRSWRTAATCCARRSTRWAMT